MKYRRFLLFSLAIVQMQLLLSSCGDDDLKKVATISDKKVTISSNRSYGVDVIYSDSAKVKARGFAPILDKVTPIDGAHYQEMPKGVKITFYDKLMHTDGTITSDYAIMKETEQITIFKKNVVVVNVNLTFNTEELIWDQNKRTFFSPKGVITKPDGTVINAVNFKAPEDFSTVDFENAFGETYIKGDLTQ